MGATLKSKHFTFEQKDIFKADHHVVVIDQTFLETGVHRINKWTHLYPRFRREIQSARNQRLCSTAQDLTRINTSGFWLTTIWSKSFSGRYWTLFPVVNGPHAVSTRTGLVEFP